MVANFYKRSADFFWIDSNNSSKWSLNNDDHLFNKSYIDFESDSGLSDSTSYWSFGKISWPRILSNNTSGKQIFHRLIKLIKRSPLDSREFHWLEKKEKI